MAKHEEKGKGKLWGGRFLEGIDATVDRFNASLRFDQRLYSQDIDGSIAHCRMLAKQKIIKDEESYRIVEALESVERRGVPRWLTLDKEHFKGTLSELPTREEITIPIQEQLIVELLSRQI